MARVFLTSGSAWVVPSDCRKLNFVDCIGGGGSGAASNTSYPTGGGGGGFSRITNLVVTPGATISYFVGPGGPAVSCLSTPPAAITNGNGGSASWFYSTATCYAAGGLGGRANAGGAGGAASSGNGATRYSGGAGGACSGIASGTGGGGAAGPNGNGIDGVATSTNGTYTNGGAGGAGAGGAANSGAGNEYGSGVGSGGGGQGNYAVYGTSASAGGAYGAGGGGCGQGGYSGGTAISGAGTQGIIVIDYTPYVPQPPTVTALSAQVGNPIGGETITVTGTNFNIGVTSVKFGTVNATSFTPINNTTLTCVTPSQPDGTAVNVKVTTADGTSGNSAANLFTYKSKAVGFNMPMMGF
jgi:IPT/TIG domain/Glycine-rich domain